MAKWKIDADLRAGISNWRCGPHCRGWFGGILTRIWTDDADFADGRGVVTGGGELGAVGLDPRMGHRPIATEKLLPWNADAVAMGRWPMRGRTSLCLCWLQTPPSPASRHKDSPQNRRNGSCPGIHKAVCAQPRVDPVQRQQLLMPATLDDPAVVHDQDLVGMSHR